MVRQHAPAALHAGAMKWQAKHVQCSSPGQLSELASPTAYAWVAASFSLLMARNLLCSGSQSIRHSCMRCCMSGVERWAAQMCHGTHSSTTCYTGMSKPVCRSRSCRLFQQIGLIALHMQPGALLSCKIFTIVAASPGTFVFCCIECTEFCGRRQLQNAFGTGALSTLANVSAQLVARTHELQLHTVVLRLVYLRQPKRPRRQCEQPVAERSVAERVCPAFKTVQPAPHLKCVPKTSSAAALGTCTQQLTWAMPPMGPQLWQRRLLMSGVAAQQWRAWMRLARPLRVDPVMVAVRAVLMFNGDGRCAGGRAMQGANRQGANRQYSV
mmetsp:Transcript_34390/g.102160  ORF Transcript_34390/g.102160 Transcript_34390/m.102160 type:complete len:326 (+) Transcript_34390:437-1414(+)